MLKDTIVFYHKDCPDGFSAAWAAWKKIGSKASYLAISHTDPAPSLKNKNLFFLDIACPEKVFKKLVRENKSVVLIDHHLTTQHLPKSASDSLFSFDHSGAYLAWKYFHKKPVPRLISYVEDYDLWKLRLLSSRELNSYIETKEYNFKEWGRLASDFERMNLRKKFTAFGKAVLDYKKRRVEDLARKAEIVEFFGHKVFAINSPELVDDLCHYLANKKPPFAIAWHKRGNFLKVSMRSINFDVRKIAEKFSNGGGHREAAGFSIPANKKLPWKSLKK